MDALATLARTDLLIVLITNQSGLGRGLFEEDALRVLHSYMVEQVTNHGGRIDAIYYCPHHPDDGCDCRKPRPGLLLRAHREIGIDLGQSYLIGDQESDVLAGHEAGCKAVILDREGLAGFTSSAEKCAGDLSEAVGWVLDEAFR
jgi:histidinol-phosphate phosphatase family protein